MSTMNGLLEKRFVLPEQLQKADEELVEKYVTTVSFIYRGIQNGKKLLQEAEEKLSKASDASSRKIAQEAVNFAIRTLPKRYNLPYPDKNDELLDQLEHMRLISTEHDKTGNRISRPVKLIDGFSDENYEAIVTAYKGIYPPVLRHVVTKNPGKLFLKIISQKYREKDILRPQDAESTPDWAFHISRCFNNALDIKLITRTWNKVEYTAWTQGSNFAFKQGDVLYRNLSDYKIGTPCIQINAAIDASAGKDDSAESEDGELAKANNSDEKNTRFPGSVTFVDFDNQTRTMTQDDFVSMLITGKGSQLPTPKFDANGQGLLF